MNRIACILLIACFLITGADAVPKTIQSAPPEGNPLGNAPQVARDLVGLDPREGKITKSLRGTFTVRHYVSGPWKGGSAVIELASDLSYAEIRIFDPEGNLQRIYSIQPKSQNTRINPANVQNPIKMVEQVNADDAAQGSANETSVARSPTREAAVQAQTEQAVQAGQEQRAFDQGARMAKSGTVSVARGSIREGSAEEAIEADERARAKAVSAAPATRKKVVKVRKKRLRKAGSNPLDTPLSGPAPKYEYYYEEVVITEQVGASETADAAPEAAVTQTASVPPPPAAAPVPPPPPAAAVPPPPPPTQTASARASSGSSQSGSSRSKSKGDEAVQVASVPSGYTGVSRPASMPTPSVPAKNASSAYDESNLPDVTDAVREDEADVRKGMASDGWKPKKGAVTPVPEPVDLPEPPPPPKRKKEEPVIEDLSAAQKAAQKLDSDQWTPKGGGRAPTDAELGLTPLPDSPAGKRQKRSKGGGDDDLVPMADDVRRGGQVATGSQDWSPVATAKLSPQEQKTQAMLNSLNIKPTQTQGITKVNRDVNNPEESMKPFYSLEKFSGPQYGRHREFERRVIYKQNPRSPVRGYDFFIDEVDRKQEKHYLYYYKVDSKKKAKLIATEKHEKVTFLSNYDIGTEDAGKIERE